MLTKRHFERVRLSFIAVVAFILCSHWTADSAPKRGRAKTRYAKNMILFVGNGMDYHQVAITQELTGKKLFMSSLPVRGTLLTTAESTKEMALLMERFKQKKRLTGIVKTGEIRDLKGSVDVVLGGGRRHFLPPIIDKMKKAGYHYVSSAADLPNFRKLDKKLLGLFSDSHLHFEIDREEIPKMRDEPPLEYMTQKAIALLSRSPYGFFLMVEGSRIEDAGRQSDTAAMAKEIIAFNKAIRAAAQFAKKNGQTMIIVMSDHKNGGLVSTGGTRYDYLRKLKVSAEYMARQIKAGPITQEKIGEVLKKHAHLEPIPAETVDHLRETANNMTEQSLSISIGSLLAKQSGMLSTGDPFEAGALSRPLSSPVPLFGFGPQSALFSGIVSSHLISEKLSRAARVSLAAP